MSAPELQVVTEVDADEMAAIIGRIGDGMSRLLAAGLNRRALTVLLKDHSGVPVYQINKVLDSLATLKAAYTTLKAKKGAKS